MAEHSVETRGRLVRSQPLRPNDHKFVVTDMEYSLTSRMGATWHFETLEKLFDFIRKAGELDGWTIRVHHM